MDAVLVTLRGTSEIRTLTAALGRPTESGQWVLAKAEMSALRPTISVLH
jgi:hypothetical protein